MGEWILLDEASMRWIDLLGYAASATVLATFCMNTMIPLRATAILSNILFASVRLRGAYLSGPDPAPDPISRERLASHTDSPRCARDVAKD